MYHVRNALRILLILTLLTTCVWSVSATSWWASSPDKPLIVTGFQQSITITDGVYKHSTDKGTPLGFAASTFLKNMKPVYVTTGAGAPGTWDLASANKIANTPFTGWQAFTYTAANYNPGTKNFNWVTGVPVIPGTVLGTNENVLTGVTAWGAPGQWLVYKYETLPHAAATVPIHFIAAFYRTGWGSATMKCTASKDPTLAIAVDPGLVSIDGGVAAAPTTAFYLASDGKSSVSQNQILNAVQAGFHTYTYTCSAGSPQPYTTASGSFIVKDGKTTSLSCKIRAI